MSGTDSLDASSTPNLLILAHDSEAMKTNDYYEVKHAYHEARQEYNTFVNILRHGDVFRDVNLFKENSPTEFQELIEASKAFMQITPIFLERPETKVDLGYKSQAIEEIQDELKLATVILNLVDEKVDGVTPKASPLTLVAGKGGPSPT